MKYDIVIVGAGPAGSAAGKMLAKAGLRTLILDKAPFPRYKTCGSGLLPGAQSLIDIDLTPLTERTFHGVDIHILMKGLFFQTRHEEQPVVIMTMRDTLDHALLQSAQSAGVDFWEKTALTGITPTSTGATLNTSRGPVETTMVIAADGANSSTARFLGLPPHKHCVPALEWEVRVSDADFAKWSERCRFDFDVVPRGYGWVFPKKGHLSIGVGSLPQCDLNACCEAYMNRLGIKPTSIERHGFVIPWGLRKISNAGPVLLVGDVLGAADPVTLEGIGPALKTGRLAADAIIAGGLNPERIAKIYASSLVPMRADHRRAIMLARILYTNQSLRIGLFRSQGQRLTDSMMNVIMGRRTYSQSLPSMMTILRMLGRSLVSV